MRDIQKTKMIGSVYVLIAAVFVVLIPAGLLAQATVSTAVSQPNVEPNETFTVTLSVSDALDIYYFGVEVSFDPQVLEFVGATHTGLLSGGLSIAELLAADRVGASATLTSPLATPGPGDLMEFTFRALQTATVGETAFTFEQVELNDSNGSSIETSAMNDQLLQIDEAVSDLKLTIDALNTIVEGEELTVTGSVYVNDITVTESTESGRVNVWVGVSNTDTDPSGWSELDWTLMEFSAQEDSYHLYQNDVGFLMDAGTYYIALRAQLDTGDFVYGGRSDDGGGIWDGTDNVNAVLTIDETLPFRYALAAWDFDDELMSVSSAVPANEAAEIELVGASLSGFSSGADGQAANSNSWDENGEKYWLATVSTSGFSDITVSSKQYGSGTGPANFQIEASLDGIVWEPIAGGTISVGTNWSDGVVEGLSLPAGYNDQETMYIRWLRVGDTNINGETGLSSTGTNRIDDVIIRGENTVVVEVTVWPGDTNNDGTADEVDVLGIGQYWLSEGPTPVYPGINWAGRTVEAWIPEAATYADAGGDGIVNHRDLMPLGLNFGESHGLLKQTVGPVSPLAEINLKQLNLGEGLRVEVQAEKAVSLTGLSYRFRIEGIQPSEWKLKNSMPGKWAEAWSEADRLLTFDVQDPKEGRGSISFIHKGKTEPQSDQILALFDIEATAPWPKDVKLVLERVVVAENRNQQQLETAYLRSDGVASNERGLPVMLHLSQNYPNPFNPYTVIDYALTQTGEVNLSVYDLLGRRVATLADGMQNAGYYQHRFDASHLSSGIYFYRLQAEGQVLTRSFTLIK